MTTVGAQLRALRETCGYSLAGVKAVSGGRWHPAAVGSWERETRDGGIATVGEYVAGMYGRRIAFIPTDVTDEQLSAALKVLAGGVDADEFAAALAIARMLQGRAVADEWQAPQRLREVA